VEGAGALVDARVLRAGAPLRFVHPIVGAAIYEEVPTAERTRLHARAARLLVADEAPIDQVAAHLLHTQPAGDEWVSRTLRAAASRALTHGSPDGAVTYLRRALAELPGKECPELLTELGVAQLRASHPGLAAEHLLRALAQVRDPGRRVAIGLDLGRALAMAGGSEDKVDVLDRLISDLESVDGEAHPRLEAEAMSVAALDFRARQVVARRLPRLLRSAMGKAPAQRVVLANLAFEVVVRGRDAGRAAELAQRALDGGGLLEQEGCESLHYYLAAWTLALCDRLDEADRALAAAADNARLHGSRLGLAAAACFRSNVLVRRGHVAEADAAAASALEVAESGWRLGLPLAAAFRTDALLERDDLATATEVIEGAEISGATPDSAVSYLALGARGRLRIAKGEVEAGLRDLLECRRSDAAWGSRSPAIGAWRSDAALALARLDRHDEAEELAAETLEQAHVFGAPTAVATALRTRGLIDRDGEGPGLLARAADLLVRSPGRLELARTRVDLGAALRRRNRRSAARKELRAGLELAEWCGARALAKRARAEIRAAGGRARRPQSSGAEALTTREREVATLAANGLSNREIARDLFVTVKTVEWHLAQSYRKLEVRSRRELPATLGNGQADESSR
jgi:DNA-binding CsgD family transcriptional regulator